MKDSNSIYPVPFSDFKRICSLIYTVEQFRGKDLRSNCVFINTAAALILKKHYKINANVCTGAAVYKLSNSNNSTLALMTDKVGNSSESGFHCWIDTGEWIIDFTSPMYSEMLKQAGVSEGCESKMFQKQHSQVADSPAKLNKAGDFIIRQNPELTKKIINDFFLSSIDEELLIMICKLYIKPPEEMPSSAFFCFTNNITTEIKLIDINIIGAW